VDIYQGDSAKCIKEGKCICWKNSPLPSRAEQKGGYEVKFTNKKT